MLDENLDKQPSRSRHSLKLRSRRHLVSRSLQILNSFLESSAQINQPVENMPASPQEGITRRQFGQSVAMAGAALAALPEIAFSANSAVAAAIPAVSEPLAKINFDTMRYLSGVISNHSDRVTKVIFAEKLMPGSKLVFSSGESEYLMNDCFMRAARQGEEFARQVLANVEDHFQYPGTDYVLDRELRYFCEKQQYRYWHSCVRTTPDYLPPLSEVQYKKMFRDIRQETLQFIRQGFASALQKVNNNASGQDTSKQHTTEQDAFHPVSFAVDAGNIVINWRADKKLLSLSRPELPGLFPNYSLAWSQNTGHLEVGPEETQAQQLVMRGGLMQQFTRLVHQTFPNTINRTLRSSTSGLVLKYPPEELLRALGIKVDVSYHGEMSDRPSGLHKNSNIYHACAG